MVATTLEYPVGKTATTTALLLPLASAPPIKLPDESVNPVWAMLNAAGRIGHNT